MFIPLKKDRIFFYSPIQMQTVFVFLLVIFTFSLFNNSPKYLIDKSTISKSPFVLEIMGKIKFPGFYSYSDGISILEALKRAGWTEKDIYISFSPAIYFSSIMNGSKITVDKAITVERFEPEKYILFFIPFDINVITKDQLKAIPGIGEKLAQNITFYRSNKGCFRCLEEIKTVDGIGENTFRNFKQYFLKGE